MPSVGRPLFFVGKLGPTMGLHKTTMFIDSLAKLVKRNKIAIEGFGVKIAIAPAPAHLIVARQTIQNAVISEFVKLAVEDPMSGQHPGGITFSMAKSPKVKASYSIIGRRSLLDSLVPLSLRASSILKKSKGDGVIKEMVKKSLDAGMRPIVCVGETSEKIKGGEVAEVIFQQVSSSLPEGPKYFSAKKLERIIFAYKPLWEVPADKIKLQQDLAQGVLLTIDRYLRTITAIEGEDYAGMTIFDGNVTPENVAGFITKENIHGAMIDISSPDADTFMQVILNAIEAVRQKN